MSNKYAVLARTSRLQCTIAEFEEYDTTTKVQNYTAPAGTLVKIVDEPAQRQKTEQYETSSKASTHPPSTLVQIYVYDAVLREPDTTRLYNCQSANLMTVSNKMWPYMLSIPEPKRRLRLLRDKKRCEWFSNAQIADRASLPVRSDAKSYDCLIYYVGPVPEIHPIGYFFGLKLLNSPPLPEAARFPFAGKYFDYDPRYTIFTTADYIVETPPFDAAIAAVDIDNEESGIDCLAQ